MAKAWDLILSEPKPMNEHFDGYNVNLPDQVVTLVWVLKYGLVLSKNIV